MSLRDSAGRRPAAATVDHSTRPSRGLLHVALLGQFGMTCNGRSLRVRGDRRRVMLTMLLLNSGHTVPAEDLIHRVWGAEPVRANRNALQVHVARARAVFEEYCGTAVIQGGDGGYRVDLATEQSDLLSFRSLVRRADTAEARGEPGARADLLIRALALWRGPLLADVVSPTLHEYDLPPVYEELLGVAEAGFGAAMARGDYERVAEQIAPIVAHHPEREPLVRIQMAALYHCGRPSESLRVYARTRAVLAERLGADPGHELQQTYEKVLRGDLAREGDPAVPHQRVTPDSGRGGTGRSGHGAEKGALGEGPPDARAPATDPERPSEQTPGPLRAPDRAADGLAPAELPAAPAPLVGRTEALAELDRLVDPRGTVPGSVLVCGPAGAGTSATALCWAHAAAPHFTDGQLYVNLRGDDGTPRDPAEVVGRLVRSLSAAGADTLPTDVDEAAARARTLTAHRRVLLVLDNASSARQVRPLLPGASGCAVVVSSRYWLTDLLVRDGLRALPMGALSPGEAIAFLRSLVGPQRCSEAALHRVVRLSGCLPLPLRMAVAWLDTHPDRSATELVRRMERVDPAHCSTPTARMAAVLRAGPDGGRHGRGEVPTGSDPPDTSLGDGPYVRLSPG